MSRWEYDDDWELEKPDYEAQYEMCYDMWSIRHEPTVDNNDKRLITYFDQEKYVLYERTIKLYPKSEEKGIFLKNEYEGREKPSLWTNNSNRDLSDFWRLHERISEDIEHQKLRTQKLERIINGI